MKAKFKVGDRVMLESRYRRKKHKKLLCIGTVISVDDQYNTTWITSLSALIGGHNRKHYTVLFDGCDEPDYFYSYELSLLKSVEDEHKVVASRVITPDGTLLWSRFTHDFVVYHDTVTDEDYMLDGGQSYKRMFTNKVPATDVSVYDNAPWELQRTVELRGTFDKVGNRVWVPICKLSNLHIKNLIMDSGIKMDTPYFTELCYREKNGIDIPDHDYKDEGVSSISKAGQY